MASGVPLVSTKVGMAPDVIKDGENGYLVDVEGLYARVCDLIENSKHRENFKMNGIKISVNYSWERIANLYYNKLYKLLLQ